ncbi:MAG: hypothetical protein HYU79_05045 [Nitrosomonadales bacterium]|nr:hypothetical protein [Nitrosomonadales bacterium]
MATKSKTTSKATPAKSAPAKPAVAEVETCFTIMPFGGWFDDYYESIYCPAIESAGLKPCRADDLYRPSTIVTDIWSYTQTSKLVLADLSGKNPNVFYELGLAHALAKPAILVTEAIDDVPFDLRALRVLEYNKNQPRWGEILQEKITNAIKEVLQAPLQAVLPAFLSVRHDVKPKAISEQEKMLLEMRSEMDLLRREVSRTRMLHSRSLEPSEARERIQRYLADGMPVRIIVRRLSDYGVPTEWVERAIEEMRAQKSLDIDTPPSGAT